MLVKTFGIFALVLALACCSFGQINDVPSKAIGLCSSSDSNPMESENLDDQSVAKASDKSSKVDGVIMNLLEEISRLKVEMVPNNLERIFPKKKTEKADVNSLNEPQQAKPIAAVSNSSAADLAQRSMGAAAAGYRLLCCNQVSIKDREQTNHVPREEKNIEPETAAVDGGGESSMNFGPLDVLELLRLQRLLDRLSAP